MSEGNAQGDKKTFTVKACNSLILNLYSNQFEASDYFTRKTFHTCFKVAIYAQKEPFMYAFVDHFAISQ